MPERQVARETKEDVVADGKDAEDAKFLQQIGVARAKGLEQ